MEQLHQQQQQRAWTHPQLDSPLLTSPRCQQLAHPRICEFLLSLVIFLGIVGSYIPQHVRLIRRRSAKGLSSMFVLFGTTSCTFALFSILSLPNSQRDVGCCRVNALFPCIAGLLGIAQISMQWVCFVIIMFLFLIFNNDGSSTSTTETSTPPENGPPNFRAAVSVVVICVLHFLVLLVVTLVLTANNSPGLLGLSTTLGLGATALAVVQYLPQLLTTWRAQDPHGLSIIMMCIQTPGSFILAASLAYRLGPSGWGTWGMFIVTGLLQGGLLAMAVYFNWSKKRVAAAIENDADEHTNLLSNHSTSLQYGSHN